MKVYINIFKYDMLFHRVCGACRVAWSILLALGARDSDSNSDRPIPIYWRRLGQQSHNGILLAYSFSFFSPVFEPLKVLTPFVFKIRIVDSIPVITVRVSS